MKYEIILADPPWEFRTYSDKGKGRSPEKYYPTMTIDEICALPINSIAADNCALFLWAVWPRIFDAKKVIEAWGFSYRALAWEWVKTTKDGNGLRMGLGYYVRANVEPCLLAVKGRMPVSDKGVRNVLMAPPRKHSQKPDEQYNLIQRLYPTGNRIELFARQQWPGFDVWGNQVESNIDLQHEAIYGTN